MLKLYTVYIQGLSRQKNIINECGSHSITAGEKPDSQEIRVRLFLPKS